MIRVCFTMDEVAITIVNISYNDMWLGLVDKVGDNLDVVFNYMNDKLML